MSGEEAMTAPPAPAPVPPEDPPPAQPPNTAVAVTVSITDRKPRVWFILALASLREGDYANCSVDASAGSHGVSARPGCLSTNLSTTCSLLLTNVPLQRPLSYLCTVDHAVAIHCDTLR